MIDDDEPTSADFRAFRLHFAAFIKAKRGHLKLSQHDVAGRCGLNTTNYAKIERGERNVTAGTIERILLALEVDPLKVRWD